MGFHDRDHVQKWLPGYVHSLWLKLADVSTPTRGDILRGVAFWKYVYTLKTDVRQTFSKFLTD